MYICTYDKRSIVPAPPHAMGLSRRDLAGDGARDTMLTETAANS